VNVATAPTSQQQRFLAGPWRGWPLERILFALAGTVSGISAVLSAAVSPWFLLLTGFVSLNLIAYAALRNCGASLILRNGFGVEEGCGR
jgi:hypothetical protein